VGERTRIVNRMKGTLARLGIRGFNPALRRAPERLETLRTPEGATLPPNTLAELQRDMARLRFVKDQIERLRRRGLSAWSKRLERDRTQ
jgi:transposase